MNVRDCCPFLSIVGVACREGPQEWPTCTTQRLDSTKATLARWSHDGGAGTKAAFNELIAKCHEVRKTRNDLLHSAFAEVQAGGDVLGIVRLNPKVDSTDETHSLIYDHEKLSEESVVVRLKEMSETAFALGMEHLQLIHWAPFTRLKKQG